MSKTIKARYAVVDTHSMTGVAPYLHPNYEVMGKRRVMPGPDEQMVVVIGGYDRAGWTLDGYYIPRLGSGLFRAKEVNEQTVIGMSFMLLPDKIVEEES